MKKLIIPAILLFSMNISAQKSTDLKIGQTSFLWENEKWKTDDSIIFTFDNHNNLLKEETQTRNSLTKKFEAKSQRIFTYDINDNILTKIDQDWNKKTKNFENSETVNFEYNSQNLLITESKESFWLWNNSGEGSATINMPTGSKYIQTHTYNSKNLEKKHVFHKKLIEGKEKQISSFFVNNYDDKNRIIYIECHDWDTTKKASYISQKNYISYNDKDFRVSERVELLTSDRVSFREVENHKFTYDERNNLINDLSQALNYSENVFRNSTEFVYTYDSYNNRLTRLRKDWDKVNKVFFDVNLQINDFDKNSNQLSETWQYWDKVKKEFINNERNVFTYDVRNNEIENLRQDWDETKNEWFSISQTKSYYTRASDYQKPVLKFENLNWTSEQLNKANTAKDNSFMSQIEKDAILYINLARLFPKQFSTIELEDYNGTLENNDYLLDSKYKLSLIETLNTMEPVNSLTIDPFLYELAKCFAKEGGEKGTRGHERKKCKKGFDAECVSYAMSNGKDIAMQLLIDHNVESLGHRIACLSNKYAAIGISKYDHTKNGTRAVLDFGIITHK